MASYWSVYLLILVSIHSRVLSELYPHTCYSFTFVWPRAHNFFAWKLYLLRLVILLVKTLLKHSGVPIWIPWFQLPYSHLIEYWLQLLWILRIMVRYEAPLHFFTALELWSLPWRWFVLLMIGSVRHYSEIRLVEVRNRSDVLRSVVYSTLGHSN